MKDIVSYTASMKGKRAGHMASREEEKSRKPDQFRRRIDDIAVAAAVRLGGSSACKGPHVLE